MRHISSCVGAFADFMPFDCSLHGLAFCATGISAGAAAVLGYTEISSENEAKDSFHDGTLRAS